MTQESSEAERMEASMDLAGLSVRHLWMNSRSSGMYSKEI